MRLHNKERYTATKDMNACVLLPVQTVAKECRIMSRMSSQHEQPKVLCP